MDRQHPGWVRRTNEDSSPMTKSELGTKRLCTECGAKFYDLNTTPITCPKCGAVFQVVVAATTQTRSTQRPAVRQPEAPRKAEPTSPDTPDTLIEELDEDDAEVSEIVAEKDEDKEDT
jgi:uncharacterized protein (TIGR02300 family)